MIGSRLRIPEAASALGVGDRTTRRWIKTGRLVAEREAGLHGEQYLVPGQAVRSAQQVLDVVEVERPTDPNTLALAVAQAIERRDLVLTEELQGLCHQGEELAVVVGLVASGVMAQREGRRRR